MNIHSSTLLGKCLFVAQLQKDDKEAKGSDRWTLERERDEKIKVCVWMNMIQGETEREWERERERETL